MGFHDFVKIEESTAIELYKSTVEAFPGTGKRQNSTDMIRIAEMGWIPFVGMKTLYVKGLAKNMGNQNEYRASVLFKGVKYLKSKSGTSVELVASDMNKYLLERISLWSSEILVRCECPDFNWRFNFYDHVDKSLYGRKRRKYESKGIGRVANASKSEGMCKHLIKMIREIGDSKIMEV